MRRKFAHKRAVILHASVARSFACKQKELNGHECDVENGFGDVRKNVRKRFSPDLNIFSHDLVGMFDAGVEIADFVVHFAIHVIVVHV
jgi:hypothetical protein